MEAWKDSDHNYHQLNILLQHCARESIELSYPTMVSVMGGDSGV